MRKILSFLSIGHITLCSTFSFTVRILKIVWFYLWFTCLDVCNKQKKGPYEIYSFTHLNVSLSSVLHFRSIDVIFLFVHINRWSQCSISQEIKSKRSEK